MQIDPYPDAGAVGGGNIKSDQHRQRIEVRPEALGVHTDQHGLVPVARGVAILTQSSNIAINLTMQARGLPIGYMVTAGSATFLGQDLLARLTPGKLYLCTAAGAAIPKGNAANIEHAQFSGPHPAGLTGTHVHFLEGASANRIVWTIGYQDVIATGRLFLDGRLYTQRVIALAGPQIERPRLLRTCLGVDLQALCAGEMKAGDNRIISGSILGGRMVSGATSYLGRYHNQVSVLLEGRNREFMGWLSPGTKKHSNLGIYVTSFFGARDLPMTTNTNGSERAMVPVGSYEDVMPLDILPTQLLRALIVGDTEMAQSLGCMELEEEDLALCSYVCPGKYEYGPILRDNLTRIEKEG